jgi:adenylyltransferase/sulfurtransferase
MLDDKERIRYDRQIMIKDFGSAGQERLKKSRVLIVGAGGLGSAAALYLAGAGVGSLRIVDMDQVELSNLNRQVLHWEKDIGRPKVDSARDKLCRFNSQIEVEIRQEEISRETLPRLIENCDIIVDGLDNFPTRYLVNKAIQGPGIPFIYGGILGFMGMVTVIRPGQGPCLYCLFPQAPPPQKFPVLGTTPGIIGLLEANEAIKYLVGLGKPLIGRLLVYNGLETRFSEVAIEKNDDCPICGGLGN